MAGVILVNINVEKRLVETQHLLYIQMYKLCNVKLHVSAYCGHHQVSFTYSPVWEGYTCVGFIDVMHEISYIYKIMDSGITLC